MSISQRITWTLLPNGVKDATTLRASVYVSPRLSIAASDVAGGQPDLSHFSDWLAWPQRLAAASFKVRTGGSTVEAKRVSADPDGKIWSALFPASTPVHPYDFAGSDFSAKTVLSYPVATIYKNVRSVYGRLGAASSELPAGKELGFLEAQSRQYIDLISTLLSLGGNPFDGIRPRPFNPTIAQPPPIDRGDLFTALNLLTLFHRPLNKPVVGSYIKKTGVKPADIHESVLWRSYAMAALPDAQELVDKIDFHRIVAALAQYPALLRATGFVVDLEFPRPADGEVVMQALVDWNPDFKVKNEGDLRPRLRTTLYGDTFYATPRDYMKTALTDRFLRLKQVGPLAFPHPLYFDLVEMDVDGAGMKLKNFLLGWQQAALAKSYDDETDASLQPAAVSLPSLRSGGLTLANSSRDVEVARLFARNKALDSLTTQQVNEGSGIPASDPGLMSAEDIVRGYRADIYDAYRKRWFPLHARDGTFTLRNTGATLTYPGEEGMTRLAAATSTDGSNPDIVKVHETLFNWNGWSLAAPPTGNALLSRIDPASDTTNPANVVGSGEADVPGDLPLQTSFTPAAGSLPSLRFGRAYMVRVRAADLAGNSAAFTTGDAQPAEAVSNPVVYRRYEPIESPALALVRGAGGLEKPAEGESMGRVAIRTLNDVPAKNKVAIPDRARRHIVPPRVTIRFAETHGVLDGPDGKPDPTKFDTLKSHDNPLDEETWKTADGSATLTYAAANETFDLPYLPDPWALGVAFKVAGLQPGVDPKKVYVAPYYDSLFTYSNAKRPDWPNAKPFTIVISENGPAEPAFDPGTREFRVTMHKGERARLRVSSILPTAEILTMAAAAMIAEQNPSKADEARIALDIATGQHWMFTPWRVIELVHAVQKPLIKPAFLKPILIERKAGGVDAVPTMILALNSKSTAKIDVNAKWAEPNDDPAALVALPPGYVGNKITYPGPAGQPDLTPADPGIISHATRAIELKIARLASIDGVFGFGGPAPAGGAPDNRPRHVFGDTRYRRVSYEIDATTRFREFMPTAIQADAKNLTVSSAENDKNAVAWIPNAAPPPAPKLLYVVPTFGWGHKSVGNEASAWRTGGGLRVYLDRPWFETGFTEMLAVVLPPGPLFHNWAAYGDAQALPPYVTQWGADPVWVGGPVVTVAPQPDAFPLARWRAPIPFEGVDAFPAEEGTNLPPGDFPVTGLRVPEMLQTGDVDPASPGELAVAPHPVGYDAERQLWYADIVVRPGNTYYPFIRLALARYNPVSVPGAHLSSIVMTEFVQLTPDRLAIMTQKADKAHVAIFGVGTGTPLRNGARSGLFEIHTETLAHNADPDLGWQRSTAEGASGLAQLTPADLLAAKPPLLWQGEAALPSAPAGARARLVITESEVFQTAELYEGPTYTGSRVVYLETIEINPNRQIQVPSTVLTTPSEPSLTSPALRTPPPGTTLQGSTLQTNPPPNATSTSPPANTQPVPVPIFAGDWDVIVGRNVKFVFHLKQRGNTVTGNYEPGTGVVHGTVDDNGRLNLSWIYTAAGTRTKLTGRGYLDLTTPDTWQGRWWVGASPTDPTPTQPNTWRAKRAPKRG